MADLTRSEWTKLRTVRSTIWTLGMTVLIGLAASAIATGVTRAHWATMSASNKASFHPVEVSLMGVYLGGTLLLGILGILVVSSEYATGTIRATLAAAPRRPMVLARRFSSSGRSPWRSLRSPRSPASSSARHFSPHRLRTPRCQAQAPSGPSPASAFSCVSSDSWPSASQSWSGTALARSAPTSA